MFGWVNLPPPPEWPWHLIIALAGAIVILIIQWGWRMIKTPNIKLLGIYDSAQGTQDEGKVRWWHIKVGNKKRGFIKTHPAEDSEIRFWLIKESSHDLTNTEGYKGQWQKESWVEETEAKRTLRVGVENNIPIARMSINSESMSEGVAEGNKVYITETRWFVSDNPAFEIEPANYIMLLELKTGASKWFDELFQLNISTGRMEEFELKGNGERKERDKGITKKQFHKLLKKAAQPVKKQDKDK